MLVENVFQVPARPGSPGQWAVKQLCVCVCLWYSVLVTDNLCSTVETFDQCVNVAAKKL